MAVVGMSLVAHQTRALAGTQMHPNELVKVAYDAAILLQVGGVEREALSVRRRFRTNPLGVAREARMCVLDPRGCQSGLQRGLREPRLVTPRRFSDVD